MADINVNKGWFMINRMAGKFKKGTYFLFDKGTLSAISGKYTENILYVHFQKRKLKLDKDLDKSRFFILAPNLVANNPKTIKRNYFKD